MEEVKWSDLYIKDFGTSQISDKKKLIVMQKKMKSFYEDFLSPLYKGVQNNNSFCFSVPDSELTCRIMLQDLKRFYNLNSVREVLEKVAENRPALTAETIEKLIEYMKIQKERSK